MSIAHRARQIVSNCLRIEEHDITASAALHADLGANSIERVELMMDLEASFGIDVSDADAERVKTFGDLVGLVEHKLGLPA